MAGGLLASLWKGVPLARLTIDRRVLSRLRRGEKRSEGGREWPAEVTIIEALKGGAR